MTPVLASAAALALSAWAIDTATCFPPCRSGYFCHQGQCISKCNPPCPAGTECTDDARCVPFDALAQQSSPSVAEDIEVREEQSSTGPTVRTQDVACPPAIVVRPVLTESALGGSYTGAELANAANMVTGVVSDRLPGAHVVDASEWGAYSACSCRAVIVELSGYRRVPASLGRTIGKLSLLITVLQSASSAEGTSVIVQSTGEKEWGTSKPLESAFFEAASEISRVLEEYL